jgi:hypothetical protein
MKHARFAAAAAVLLACARGADLDDGFLALEPGDEQKDEETPSVKVPSSSPLDDAGAADTGATLDAAADVPPPPPTCTPCTVTGPGTFCGVNVSIAPFATGVPFGGFQSIAGTGAQTTIAVTFSQAVPWVSVRALDPDFGGNQLRAYNAASALVATIPFDVDSTPGVFTSSTKTVTAQAARVELVPDPADYLAYDQLEIKPPGCP